MVFLAEHKESIPEKDLLSWTFDDLPYDADKPVYIDAEKPERSLSGNEARKIIRKLIAGLRKWGVRPDQKTTVCVHSFNDIMYPMLFLSIIGAGGIFTGTNPAYTTHELVHHIRTSKAQFLITEPEMLDNALVAAKTSGIPNSNILIFNVLGQAVPEGFRSWETLLDASEADWVRFNDLEATRTTEAARFFSSGTTGLPKAVRMSHYNLVAQHTLHYDTEVKDFETKRLLCLPMFHVAIAPTAHTSTLKSSVPAFVMRRFDLQQFLACIAEYGINELLMVPPLVIAMIMAPMTRKYDLSGVKIARCGAAPLGKGPQNEFVKLIGGAPFTQVWGMTEAACIVTRLPYPERDETGSVGRPLPSIDIKIVDDDGNDISNYDVTGELCVRGPTVIPGYLDNPTANRESFDAEGFYHSGDIGYCDGKSKLWYIVDRKKELIKVRAFQVAPAEIEAALLSHPHIIDAAVIGVDSGEGGDQLPRAYVVRRPGNDGDPLTEQDVKRFMNERLAKYKRLEGGVRFVPAIPKNQSGKILKRLLREQAQRETSSRL